MESKFKLRFVNRFCDCFVFRSNDDENFGKYRRKDASIYGSKRSLNVNRVSFRGELRSSMINGSVRSRKLGNSQEALP